MSHLNHTNDHNVKEVTLHFNKCVYLKDALKHLETLPPSPQ